jgi:hypothetical protein
MFRRAKLFTVHIHPDGAQPYDSTRFVPEGFSVLAFLFHGFWLWFHRAWLAGLCVISVIVALHMAGESSMLSLASVGLLQFLTRIFIGLQAYDMQRSALKKRGFVLVDVVAAESLLDAQQKFFERRTVSANVAATPQGLVMA